MNNIFNEKNREKLHSYLICVLVIVIVYYAFTRAPSVNFNSCESFGDKKEICLVEFAKENKDYTVCNNIKNDTTKFFCLKETNINKLKEQYCEKDRTSVGECSTLNKGFFCKNGELMADCNKCGCPKDYQYCFQNKCVGCPNGKKLYDDGNCY